MFAVMQIKKAPKLSPLQNDRKKLPRVSSRLIFYFPAPTTSNASMSTPTAPAAWLDTICRDMVPISSSSPTETSSITIGKADSRLHIYISADVF